MTDNQAAKVTLEWATETAPKFKIESKVLFSPAAQKGEVVLYCLLYRK